MNAEAAGWGGLMVVDDAPVPVGGADLVPTQFEPTISFMRFSYDAGAQLLADLFSSTHAIELRVTWAPDVVEVTEPATFSLLASGLAVLLFRRAQAHTNRDSLERNRQSRVAAARKSWPRLTAEADRPWANRHRDDHHRAGRRHRTKDKAAC